MGLSAVETHVSWLVFTSERVYKAKRPVRFGFVDFTDPAARLQACRDEVALNARLAPDVYEGVGTFSAPGGGTEPVVVMRRLPDDRRLSVVVADRGPAAVHEVDQVAGAMAVFHAGAARGPEVEADAGPAAVTRRWVTNLEELGCHGAGLLDPSVLSRVGDLAGRYLEGRLGLLEARVAAGRAVDGHGDLLADDVFCLDDGPRILDCLEFDAFLRHEDGLGDMASLAVDLERLERPDLADRLLTSYAERAGDGWPRSLEDLYIAYRATVRSKVACIRAGGGQGPAAGEARRLLSMAQRHLEEGRVRLVLVGGPPGTGKSTLARALGGATGWPVLRSDVLRAEVTGPPTDPAGHRYRSEATDAVYRLLLERARPLLRAGRCVVLDATWATSGHRAWAAAMASECRADLVALRCQAPPDVAAHRVARRLEEGNDVSEATPEVAEVLAARFVPWPDSVAVSTEGSPDRALRAARAATGPAHAGGDVRGGVEVDSRPY